MYLKSAQKPTLQQIRTQMKTRDGATITRRLLAEKAGLSYREVYTLDVGGHLSDKTSKKVVWAFNQLSGARLTLNDLQRRGYR
jgi:hypothetical protein